MASNAPPSPPRSVPPDDLPVVKVDGSSTAYKEILSVIDSLKNQLTAERYVSVQKRMEENRKKLLDVTNHFYKMSNDRRNSYAVGTNQSIDFLLKRQNDAICMHNGVGSDGERDSSSSQEDEHAPSAVLIGSSIPVKNAVCPIKLAGVKKVPPYTTWIFLDRNQRMTEDQSVVGRRRIYYDQNGGEALICSDSEEEVIDEEEDKREFIDAEDFVLSMTIKEVGLSDVVLEVLSQCLSRKPSEINARYEVLVKGETDAAVSLQTGNSFLDKDLDAALDSFDNLFCRRCLVFDCRLHGCSQELVFPVEKQSPWYLSDDENKNRPCSLHCYRLGQTQMAKNVATVSSPPHDSQEKPVLSSDGARSRKIARKKSAASLKKTKSCQSESASSNARNVSESSDSEIRTEPDTISARLSSSPSKNKISGKSALYKRNSKRVAEHVIHSMQKRQKKTEASDSDSLGSGGVKRSDIKLRSTVQKEIKGATSLLTNVSLLSGRSRGDESPVHGSQEKSPGNILGSSAMKGSNTQHATSYFNHKEEPVDETICKQDLSNDISWRATEKGLFDKGIDIFGRNSCLIARNLLNGLKTCSEVNQYMKKLENNLYLQDGNDGKYLAEGHKGDFNEITGTVMRRRSRFLRRKGRVRRLKYTWKSAAYHSIRKRISERKDQPCRQFNPCNCQSACGKQCSCLLNGTCCEKYCGCPKSCKNRFRGCHCAKSQCRSRQCPCFAADRECDPDVCRNCWISCGDGTLGTPYQRGDNYECRNMKLLLKQQQRVLLGRSDVSGWGAFLKNNVNKHEYLGEYTGELISHREADKRGKIYDRENSSFLFNLNDQFVLDAYRKGDKLKFANHSPSPNCYAKVIMVAGDHRVGIFAKERICAGEELFYDYRYEPDRAPAWARKPEASGSKKDDAAPSTSGRAKKLA